MPRFGRVFRGFLAVGAAKPLSAALALATGATVVAIGVGAVVALREQSSNEDSTSGAAPATAAIQDDTAQEDPFEGELASIRVQTAPVSSSGFEVCSQGLEPLPVGAAEARVAAPGALAIDPAKLLPSLQQTGSAEGWVCGDEIALASRIFQIQPGTPGVNPGGGSMTVVRSLGPAVVSMSAPRNHWQELSIGTQAVALFERPASEGGGPTCLAASLESGTQVFTQVMGTNSQGSVCLDTLAAVLAQ
jgi:hypothetical protein